MLFHCLPPPSPHYPACQWCGPLIGGPGLSRHGNCTKANKGVEQSRGNTVTQRGYLAQWKISGEAHTKAKPPLNTSVHGALFCLSIKTPRLNAQMSKSAVCWCARPHLTYIPCLSSPSFALTYANDSEGDVIKLHSFLVIFHT